MKRRGLLGLFFTFLMVADARAGLYYSGETTAELPSQWRGFLLDQRMLRNIAVKPGDGQPPNLARQHYLDEGRKLETKAKNQALTADELADLGAIYVRLGEPARAVELLRKAQREHPQHFRIAANLGTAWQLSGDLRQAEAHLEQAVRLAPGKWQRAEEYHLKLVRLRQREREKNGLDDLFEVRYVGNDGRYEPGKLSNPEKKKLPIYAVAVAQQLALWLPADATLLWQLAELANAYGGVRAAAGMMDGCVTQFGLQSPELKSHRRILREAVGAAVSPTTPGAKAEHEGHVDRLPARSKRPLLTRLDQSPLPPIEVKGINALPWPLLADTLLDRNFRPTFPNYLKDLEGKTVTVIGFMQPLVEELELSSFLVIENPVGCWYCEMPEITGMIFVELPEGKTASFTRGQVRVTGRLVLNATDPEQFLYTVRDAKVADLD
jgi:tetratricopeptide (TPR) repeat protein